MAFLKRLGYYLLGLAIGLIFLALFLEKKSEETGTSFCYFPNCRVLKELRSKPYVLSDYRGPYLDSIIITGYLTDGKVNFKRSDTKAKPCPVYFIQHESDGRDGRLHLSNCRDTVRILGWEAN